MFLTEKLESPIIKLFRSDNFEFIMSFFYEVFRNNPDDGIKQVKFEKELEIFIKKYNQISSFKDKNHESAKNYTENWIKNKFLIRSKIGDFEDEYQIELSDFTVQVMNFVDNIWVNETILHSAVQSEFENALSNLKIIAYSSKSLKEHNLREIDAEIKKLEKKKALIQAWDLKSFEDEVLDKYIASKDILKKLPNSFKKVETVFGDISNSLEKIANESSFHKWNILWFTLEQIEEKINNSPQWKSFEGFEKFYSKRPKELLNALEEVFSSFEVIAKQESHQSIRSLIQWDILRAKKKAYQKKTKIISKLKDAFNESTKQERKMWISLLKEIKKVFQKNNVHIDYKDPFIEMTGKINIDLFLNKNYYEPRVSSIISQVDLNQSQKKETIQLKEIFRYTSISQKEMKQRINDFLQSKDQVWLEEILAKYPIRYGVDEFMQYLKFAKFENGTVRDEEIVKFVFQWIFHTISIESGRIEFRK